MLLSDLLDIDELHDEISNGHVSERFHHNYPLAILNYTSATQYENAWNDITMKTRGLIYNIESRKIVSRPFAKFFNLGQYEDSDIPTDASMVVLEKMDGSLGVLYQTPDGPAMASRGSFHSDQAEHATELLRGRDGYLAWANSQDLGEVTYLFEIIYPENRIVVDYGSRDDVVLLDGISISTGESIFPSGHRSSTGFPGGVVEEHFGISSLQQLLAQDRSNAEGYVVVFGGTFRVKVKHDEYVRLHRILTNVTARTVFECIAISDLRGRGFDDKDIARAVRANVQDVEKHLTIEQLIDGVPDEFYSWVHAVTNRLEGQFEAKWSEVHREFNDVMEKMK